MLLACCQSHSCNLWRNVLIYQSFTYPNNKGKSMFENYLLNGQMHGEFGNALRKVGYDDGYYRPFFNSRGEPCVTVNTGKMINKDGESYPETETRRIVDVMRTGHFNPTFNATSLRFADWIHFEKRLQLCTRQVLRAWSDLSASSSISGFDAMAKMTYEYEAMSDPGEAMASMDGRASGRTNMPQFVTSSVPLPIYHADFDIGMRTDLVSRNSGTPLSAATLEGCGRRIAELVEDTVIGVVNSGSVIGPTYGTRTGFHPHREASRVYGYTNHPSRQVKTDLTVPTGANPQATLDDVLEMRDLLYDAGFNGPFMLYHSTDWNQFMDNDYGMIGTGSSYGFAPTKTLRERLRAIDDIQDVRQLRRLTSTTNPYTLLMVEMSSQTADAINGATPRIIQWTSKGGWELNFRVYAIQVPVLKYDYNGNMGIVHGTTS